MDVEALTRGLERACSSYDVPGAQVGLLRGRDRVVACAGTRSIDTDSPVLGSTLFHAGSIAKALAALLVLDAARRGELDLDVPCDQQADGLWDDTPRALMSHTSGRPNLLPEGDEDIEAFVARVGELPRVHAPGRFSYCNAGWSVLDVLLRRRTGSSFEELADTRALSGGAVFGEPDDGAIGHGVGPHTPPGPVPGDLAKAASAAGARWWVTADILLDFARMHLDDGAGQFVPDDVRELRRPHVSIPGATVADAWGLGWALWDRGDHLAFGWAGYTGGHRAYLRCFPRQDAALVVLANSAGPLFGPPGGSALFDALLPELLETLDVPPLVEPRWSEGHAAADLVGTFGPFALEPGPDHALLLDAAAFGEPEKLVLRRQGGDTFAVSGDPLGGMSVAVDDDLLYIGPFAVPRNV